MAEITLTSEITVRLIQHVGGDHMVVAAAKVSTSGEEAANLAAPCPVHPPGHPDFDSCVENDAVKASYGLINYLMKHHHGTPFEHGLLTFFVHAPACVWWEWVRHRIGHSYNLESSRYKTLDPVFYVPDPDRPMVKVDGWKPGRPKFVQCENMMAYRALCANLKESYRLAYAKYEENLALGMDPGLARDCLPFAVYFSGWVTVNPRSMMAFLSLRTHEPEAKAVSYPLWEIEVAARKCEAIFAEHWPLTYRAFCENGRVAP